MGSREKFPEELDGQGYDFLFLARDHMVLAIAPPVSAEIEAYRCDACVGEFTCEGGHRDDVAAGEDSVHEDHRRTFAGFWVEDFRKGDVHGDAALRAMDLEVAGACCRGDQDEEDGYEAFHVFFFQRWGFFLSFPSLVSVKRFSLIMLLEHYVLGA